MKPIKISFIAIDSPSHPVKVSPVSVLTLAGYLQSRFSEKSDIDIQYLQFEFLSEIIAALDKKQPDIIGISLQVGSQETLELVMAEINETIAAWPVRPVIVFGNVLATFGARTLLAKYPDVLMAIGEGEYALAGIVEGVMAGEKNLAAVPNLVFIKDGQCIETERRMFALNELTVPYFDFVKKVVECQGHVWIEASRGCNSRCTFCSRYPVRMTCWTPAPVHIVLQTMERMHRECGVGHFRFTDDDFMGTESTDGLEHARAIAQAIIDKKLDITFDISCRVDAVYAEKGTAEDNVHRDAVFKLLRDVGLTQVFLGVESGSCTQLKRFGKRATVTESVRAIVKLIDLDIQVVMGFITIDHLMNFVELQENIDFLQKVGAFDPLRKVFVSDPLVTLRPLAGSTYVKMLSKKNLIRAADATGLSYRADYADPHIGAVAGNVTRWRQDTFPFIYALKNRVSKLSMEKVQSAERELLEKFLNKFKLLDFQYLIAVAKNVKENKDLGKLHSIFLPKKIELIERLRDIISGKTKMEDTVLRQEIEKFIS